MLRELFALESKLTELEKDQQQECYLTGLAQQNYESLQAQYRSEKNAYKQAKQALHGVKADYLRVQDQKQMVVRLEDEFREAQEVLKEKMLQLEGLQEEERRLIRERVLS